MTNCFTLVNPGIYDVSLIATHQDGCSDTLVEPYFVKMLDSLPPPVSPIFSASVLNDYSVEITWQNSASLDLSEYRLYRFNQLTGIYDLIFVDSSPTNSSISVSSSYVDAGLNTLMNSYTYKLQTVHICNNARPLGASVPHSTINVTAQPLAGNIRVFWTPYQGCVIDTYEITRTDVNSGVSSLVATVLPHITAYTDTGFYCPDDYLYRIKATGLCGVGYESLSDTSGAIPANALSLQLVDIVKSTVLNDSEVLTEWLPPVISPQRVIGYEIYRSDGDNNYVYLTSVSALEYSYIDYNVDVHTFAYHYKIQVLNDCNLKGSFSNLGTSILLQSEGTDNGDKLWWTKYNNWNTGIDHYVIEVEDSNGNWNPVKKVDGNVNTIKIE